MSEEFSTGVKIILDRIKEFPDDFISHSTLMTGRITWPDMAHEIMREKDTFTDEERKAVHVALRDARRANFDGKVIEALASPPAQDRKKILINRSMMAVARQIMDDEFNKAYGNAIAKPEGEQV